jgi:hypothetical protein
MQPPLLRCGCKLRLAIQTARMISRARRERLERSTSVTLRRPISSWMRAAVAAAVPVAATVRSTIIT